MNLYNNDAGYRVAQNKDYKALLHEIALAELVACMEDLRKNLKILSVFKFTCRPHKAVQESA